ncbi:hypothetical protein BC332_14479 [Capsicum chinense]|nr:hypothetical protein BC332_14479 [Capsicum chinense]
MRGRSVNGWAIRVDCVPLHPSFWQEVVSIARKGALEKLVKLMSCDQEVTGSSFGSSGRNASYDKQEDVLIKSGFYDEQVEVNEEEVEDTTCLLLDKTVKGMQAQESDLCYDMQQVAKTETKSVVEETCLLSDKTVEDIQDQESGLCFDVQQLAKAGTKSVVKETTCLLSDKTVEGIQVQESDLYYDLQQIKASTKTVVEETTCLLSEKMAEGMQVQESDLCYDLQQVAKAGIKSMVEEEENEDNMSTEELNKKIEEFIRKMKEEIRTENMP